LNESHVFLFDDALDLWLATIERSTELTPPMAEIFSAMPQLLTVQSENLRCCLEILKAYVAFGNSEFAQIFLPKFDAIFAQILQQMRSEGQAAVLRTVEMTLKVYSKNDAILSLRETIGFCLRAVLGLGMAEKAEKPPLSVQILCYSVISLVSQRFLNEILAFLGDPETVDNFLTGWLKCLGLLSHDLDRLKLNAMALGIWCTNQHPTIAGKFAEIVATISEILPEIMIPEQGQGAGEKLVDSLTFYDFGVGVGDPEGTLSAHDRRMEALRNRDPVYTEPLNSFIRQCFTLSQQNYGQLEFERIWASVDEDVKTQLQKFFS